MPLENVVKTDITSRPCAVHEVGNVRFITPRIISAHRLDRKVHYHRLCAVYEVDGILLPHAAPLEYAALGHAFIIATFCTIHKVGDARSAARGVVGIYHLASTGIPWSTTPGKG